MRNLWRGLAVVSLAVWSYAQAAEEITAQQAQQAIQQQLGVSEAEAKETQQFIEQFYKEGLTKEQKTQQMMQSQTKYFASGGRAGQAAKPGDGLSTDQFVLTKEREQVFLKQLNDEEKKRYQLAKQHPLFQQAQLRATDQFYKWYCETFLGKRDGKGLDGNDEKFEPFKGIDCEAIVEKDRATFQKEGEQTFRATAESNDDVASLVATWIPKQKVDRSMDLLTKRRRAETKLPLWSDDYWSIAGGVTSARYARGFKTNTNGANWRENVGTYAQPGTKDDRASANNLEWNALWNVFKNAATISSRVNPWSPAEKMDVSVGDTVGRNAFTLVNNQKKLGGRYEKDGEVETWMGICHGWAPASMMVPPAEKEVTVTGSKGVKVKWNRHDIAAMQQLAWANGSTAEYSRGRWVRSSTNFVGGRCNLKDPRTNDAGRLVQQECFDNNPATFLLSLANMIGNKGLTFVMDKTFNYEVWNQPIQEYRITFFNPLNPRKTCTNWDECDVPYDDAFKRKDRFTDTRGTRNPRTGRYDDSGVKKIVGFMVSVWYISESQPTVKGRPSNAVILRANYSGDLEIHKEARTLPGTRKALERINRNKWIAAGGEWHHNAHPDFLWVPRRNSVPYTGADLRLASGSYDGKVSGAVTDAARNASSQGMPLCQVVKHLTNEAMSDKKHLITPKYVCPLEDVPAEWKAAEFPG